MNTVSGRWRLGVLALALAGAGLVAGPAGQAASGRIFMFTSNPSLETTTNNFGGFLRGLGYTLTVQQDAGSSPYEALDTAANAGQLIAQLTNSYDLIVIHRNYGSGTLASTAAELAIWNNLNVPILLCNAPIARNNRWKWLNSSSSGAIPADRNLNFIDPGHPIVAGLDPDLFVTNGVIYGGVFNVDASPVDGGPYMTAVAQANMVYGPASLAVWDERAGEVRTFYEGSGQTYTRRRVYFEMPEYRNGGTWAEVSRNGGRMWANAVAYAMTGQVPPEPPAILDLAPAAGSSYNSAATTFGFRTTSAQAIFPEGIQVVVNGQDVSGALQVTGAANSRIVDWPGLAPNQLYNIAVTVTNALGARAVSLQFDTFDPARVAMMWPYSDDTFAAALTQGTYRAFVQLQSSTPQVAGLTESRASEVPATARLKGVFYLPGSMDTGRLFPLTDALGTPVILRLPTDLVTFGVAPLSGVVLWAMHLVPVPEPADPLLPTIGRATPYPGQADVSVLAGIDLELVNGDAAVAPASVRLFVDGAEVTSASQTTIAGTASGAEVHYSPPNFLAPGQAHTVQVVLSDTAARTVSRQYAFSTVDMPALPASMALPPDAGISRGFNLRLYASPNNPDRIFTNSSARARLQIEGALVGPSGPVTNEISHGLGATLRLETQAINYSQDGLDTGQFPGDTLFPVGEGVVPSLMAMEARAYLRLPAGVVTFGVASDDGFLLTAGDPDNLVLGAYEGTRGSQVPSEFPVLVYRAGVYPVGLLYYDGGGYASVEFYTAHNESATATQGRVLANADDEAGNVPVAAYTMVAPSAPTLHLRRDAGELVFSWSTNANYRLQETLRLNPASWTPTSLAPVLEGALLTGRLPLPTGGNKFYRLELQP